MVITKRFPTRYYSQVDFPVVMATVVLFLLINFMIYTKPMIRAVRIDLPRVSNPTLLPRSERHDAMMLAIMRDGTMYFGQYKITNSQLVDRIREEMSQRGVEKRVYIKADLRTQYGNVNTAIDAIHDAGIERIAFIVEQRKASFVPATEVAMP